jgi:hypothetical protein
MEPMEYGDDYDDFAAMGLDIPHPYVDEDRTRLDDVLGDAKRLIDDIESMKAADRRGGAGGSGGDELPAGMGVRAGGGAEESAPCCRTTGPCAWDRVCEVHLKDWEKASGGEKYCDWLRRNGHTVPAWMQGAKPGQRGSNASHAAAGVFFAPEKRPDALLDVAVSERAEYWDGGAADVEPEPLAFPMMDDDDDEFAYPPPASATQTRETNGGGAEDDPHGGPETPSLGAVVDERRNDGDGAPSVAVGEAEFAELAEDAYGGGDGRAGRGTLGGKRGRDESA